MQDFSQLAWRYEGSGQWERMLEAAHAWLAADPESAEAHRLAARAQIKLDRPKEALLHLAVVLRQWPDNATAFHLSSVAKLDHRDFRGAEEDIRRAIELDPVDAEHWAHLAWICHQQRDKASGLRWATKAHELSPANAHVLNLLAICQPDTKSGRALCAKYTEDALALRPNSSELLNNQGLILLKAGRTPEAEAHFRRSLALNPRSAISRANLLRAIRRRDAIYRILNAPIAAFAAVQAKRRGGGGRIAYVIAFLLILGTGLGGVIALPVLAILCLLLPIVRLYEYITIGDLRAKAGEIGARRGGFLGHRRWSFGVRISLFLATTLLFWGACALLVSAAVRHDREHRDALPWTGALIVVPLLIVGFRGWVRIFAQNWKNWRRASRLRKLPLDS